jgi:SPP1 gp7 family putative phage head morphogenesis protein
MANLHALPPVNRADLLRQRKALVARARARRARSAEARRRGGYQPPNAARLAYTASLRKLVARMWTVVLEGYASRVREVAAREDDLRSATSTLAGEVRVKLFKIITEQAPAIVDRAAAQVSTHNLRESKRVLGIDPRIDPGSAMVLDDFRRENVRLITSIAEQQLSEVEGVISESFGLRVEEISTKLQERFGVTESRGDLIARDQTLKLNGQLTKVRQQAAGIAEYIWTTSKNENVRPEHDAREGQRFRWDTPPEDGHPGEPIQCCCTAYPVVPGLDEST